MIILIFLIILLLYRISKIRETSDRRVVINAVLLNSFLSICFLILLQLEIYSNNGLFGTIGTDAYHYFSTALNAINSNVNPLNYIFETLGRDLYLESRGYEVINYLLFLGSPFYNAELLKVFNILVFQNTLILIFKYIKNANYFNQKDIKWIMYFIALNGAFIFTSTRIFKDTIYIYLLFEFLVTLNSFINKSTTFTFTKIVIISVISGFFRPYSFFMNLIIFIVELFLKKYKPNSKKIKYLFVSIILGIIFSLSIIQFIKPLNDFVELRYSASQDFSIGEDSNSLRDSFNESTRNNVYLRYALGVARFVALPSPFRNLFTDINDNIYWFEGITGKLLVFQWSIFYYICLGSLILLFTKYYKDLYYFFSLFLINALLVSTYALLYAGASQTRWKLSLVLFGVIALGVFLKRSNKSEKILMMIFTLGLLFMELIWALQWV